MEELDVRKALDLFIEWSKANPGKWIERSINVAEIAKRIANAIRVR